MAPVEPDIDPEFDRVAPAPAGGSPELLRLEAALDRIAAATVRHIERDAGNAERTAHGAALEARARLDALIERIRAALPEPGTVG